jgi:putative PEP-CTERM system TPR-repeat lipoprotein
MFSGAVRSSRALLLLMALAGPVVLSGCGEPQNYTIEERLDRAREARVKGELRKAILELKNALKDDPKSIAARYLLGQIYIDMEDGVAAEKELTVARDLGLDVGATVVPLAQSWILQAQYEKVIEQVGISQNLPAGTQAALHIVHGDAYTGMQQWDNARAAYERALQLDANNPLGYVGLGNLSSLLRDWDMAKKYHEQALRIDPTLPQVISLEGDIAAGQGDFKNAVKAYERLVELRPENVLYRTVLAWAYTNTNNYKEATSIIGKVLAIVPDYPPANHIRAVIALKQQKYQDAYNYADRVLAVDPERLSTLLVQGASAYAMGRLEQAYSALNRYVNAVPDDRIGRKLLASVYMDLGRADDAYTVLAPIAEDPVAEKDPQLLNLVAVAALQRGDMDTGRRYLQKSLAASPESAAAITQLGLTEISLGNINEGLDELRRAVALDPSAHDKRMILALHLIKLGRWDEATVEAKAVQKAKPDKAQGFILEGVIHAAQGHEDAAKEMFTTALKLEPGNPSASFNMLRYAAMKEDWKEARRLLNSVLEKNPDHERALLLLADLERRQNKPDRALALLQRAAGKYPESREPAILLAHTYLNRGDAVNAIAAVRKIAPIYANDPALLEVTGRAELMSGQPANAVVTFERLVEVAGKDPLSHHLLAIALEDQGNFVRSEESLKKALELAPKLTQARFSLARVKARLGQLDEAQKLLDTLVAEKPADMDMTELHIVQGVIASARQDYGAARKSFAEAYKAQPNSLNARRLAEVTIISGKTDEGLAVLSDWLKQYPDDWQTRFFMGNQLLGLNRLDAAAAEYQQILKQQKDQVDVLNNLAWTRQQQGKLEEAAKLIERAIAVDSNNPNLHDTAGGIYMAQKEYRRAASAYRRALDLSPQSGNIRERYAHALIAAGRNGEAREVLGELLQGPYAVSNREKLEMLYLKLAE